MSALSALKGYRTQFLYSLHYILSNLEKDYFFRLEGEEDLDVQDKTGAILYAIQVKNLGRILVPSDILSNSKTSFLKRFLNKYSESIPILVSYGDIGKDIKDWLVNRESISAKENTLAIKYGLSIDEWKKIKSELLLLEVSEEAILVDVEKMMKDLFPMIDPIPTIGFLLNWLQFVAEKQLPISKRDFFEKVESFAQYLSERLAIHDLYGIYLRPLHIVSTETNDVDLLEKEFYGATLTRFEHILHGLDVIRTEQMARVNKGLAISNVVIVKGASGQGKTTLIYSYVYHFINDWLSFELNIQQDFIQTQKAIQAIAGIGKKLDVPVAVVINVTPNTTGWIQVVRESAYLQNIKFLVSIRNEDWYRAADVGIEIQHELIDLVLSKVEAMDIYQKLNQRSKIIHYNDFEEAWIQLGSNAPLLEFVFSLIHGDSLYNRLKQQVRQILREGGITNNEHIEFLRIVCLADAMGARIDVDKLDKDYQFIIESLENEYLVKKSDDGLFIQGLHMVRSQILCEILFDEFISKKEEGAYKCIPLLAENDLYLFLVQAFHDKILNAGTFISNIGVKFSINDWSVYTAVLKVHVWLGVIAFVEMNKTQFDEAYLLLNGVWYLGFDFMFGTNYDRHAMLNLWKIPVDIRLQLDKLNSSAVQKQHIFDLVTSVIDEMDFPKIPPRTKYEWKSFGEALFWLRNIPNNKADIPLYEYGAFESAFETMDSHSLSKLMLGMHTYSPKYDSLRLRLHQFFVDRVKYEYDLVHIGVDGEEVKIHYIIDVLQNSSDRLSNDFVVLILDILRSGFPEKKKFSSQAYGHRLNVLSVEYDPTSKGIAIENMPLKEWVNINASIIKIYEYSRRPSDWQDYKSKLNVWGNVICKKIDVFNKTFELYNKGVTKKTPVVSIMETSLWVGTNKILEPQCISDPLGLFGDKGRAPKSEEEKAKIHHALRTKYENFFSAVSDFKGSVEAFLKQSSQTLISRIQLAMDKDHKHDEHLEHLSQTNLFDAIIRFKDYQKHYDNILGNIEVSVDQQINASGLMRAAINWRDFLNDSRQADHSLRRLDTLKTDFEKKLLKLLKKVSIDGLYSIQYHNGRCTDGKAVLLINAETPVSLAEGISVAFQTVKDCIGTIEYTSLKYLMLRLWFADFYFLPLVRYNSIQGQWSIVTLHTVLNSSNEDMGHFHWRTESVDMRIMERFKIDIFAKIYPEFNAVRKTADAFGKLIVLVDHINDLNSMYQIEMCKEGFEKLEEHIRLMVAEIKEVFQQVIYSLGDWLEAFPIGVTASGDIVEEIYATAIFGIRDTIFSVPKGEEANYEAVITRKMMGEWGVKLKKGMEYWNLLILAVYGKYINLYKGLKDSSV